MRHVPSIGRNWGQDNIAGFRDSGEVAGMIVSRDGRGHSLARFARLPVVVAVASAARCDAGRSVGMPDGRDLRSRNFCHRNRMSDAAVRLLVPPAPHRPSPGTSISNVAGGCGKGANALS